MRYNKILNLTNALLGDYRFEFDSRDDLLDLFNDKAKMLNQRAITDALMAHGYSKTKFLNWVDKYSKFLDKDRAMIHDILDSYTELDIDVPNAANGTESENNTATANTPAQSVNSSSDDDDFESVFGSDGEESDTDLFGGTASKAGSAARVSAADALARIKAFDFSI